MAAVSQTALIDFEQLVLVPISQSAVVDWEQVITGAISQTAVIDFELSATAVAVSQQSIINYENSELKKLFCPEPAPASIVTTCPSARTIRCIREG
jgi:hypothetical protein